MTNGLPYCIYVLISQTDGNLYTGFTTDLQRRLDEHNSGRSLATAPRRPFRLLFCEYHASKSDALKREKCLKTSAGKRTLRLTCHDALAEFREQPRSPTLPPGETTGSGVGSVVLVFSISSDHPALSPISCHPFCERRGFVAGSGVAERRQGIAGVPANEAVGGEATDRGD